MNTFTLQANHHRPVPYTVPPSGKIRFEVDSEYPTSTLILDEAGYAAFRSGSAVYYRYGGFDATTEHRQELILAFRGTFYLVIVNYSLSQSTAAHYNVWFP